MKYMKVLNAIYKYFSSIEDSQLKIVIEKINVLIENFHLLDLKEQIWLGAMKWLYHLLVIVNFTKLPLLYYRSIYRGVFP